MKTLSITTAATLALILTACSPSPEAEDAETAAATPAAASETPAKTEEPGHEDDDAAEPTAEDHGHEHADGEDADHAH